MPSTEDSQSTQSPKETQKVWIVVKVVRGIPWYVEAYDNQENAKIRARKLAEGINLDEDEVGYYETIINSPEDDLVNLHRVNELPIISIVSTCGIVVRPVQLISE